MIWHPDDAPSDMTSNAKDVAAIRLDPRRFDRFIIQPISCDTPRELPRAMPYIITVGNGGQG
jgi:hypothetical protein